MTTGSQEAQGLLWGAEPDGWASHERNHSPLFEAATFRAVEPLTAADGSISFDTNRFIFVVGSADCRFG